jgi:hypothetical protein
MLDFEQAFSNRKRAWQGRGAYSKIKNTYPRPKAQPDTAPASIAAFPSDALAYRPKGIQPAKSAKNGKNGRSTKSVIKPVFPRYAARHSDKDDAEMGFLPIIAAAIPAVTGLVSSLFSKKSSKTGQPPPEANTAKQILDTLAQAGVGGGGSASLDIKDIVKNIVQTIPSPVIDQVKAAIADMKNKSAADENARDLITANIDAKFQPQIAALLASIKTQNLQTQATHEHKTLKEKEAFRTGTTESLSTALKSLDNVSRRLSAIEARLQSSAVASGKTKIALLGGRSVIEG